MKEFFIFSLIIFMLVVMSLAVGANFYKNEIKFYNSAQAKKHKCEETLPRNQFCKIEVTTKIQEFNQ